MDWQALLENCSSCHKCALGDTRTNVVFGAGQKNASLLFVGEAPGEAEDLSGVPFVGRAGQLLNSFLDEVGIARDKVYIANILKCRPPENRDPSPAEEEACRPWLEAQIRLIDPRVIVCLGRIAAARLIKPDFRITKEHGVWFDREGRLITAVYHPAYLLRDPRKRPDFKADLRRIYDQLQQTEQS
ncbi:MAG: uracil-DNA glycosylase [Clostridia bacterium]|nr:uracil-DNA glycosylase [Clostridia bacterium]